MRFEEALKQNPAPRSVGDVTLSYDAPVLIGEARAPAGRARLLPEALFVCAVVIGVVAISVLVIAPGSSITPPLVLAACAGLLIAVAARADRRVRHRRRFLLHFGEETLRIDVPGGFFQAPRTRTVHFDSVRDVYVLTRTDGRFTLVVEFAPAEARPRTVAAVLVDDVREDEADELARLWSALRAAFGLRAAPAES